MNEFVIKKIERNLSLKDFDDIGFSKIYKEAELSKSKFIKLKIFDLTVIQANILKQTALSKGCDCAVNEGCLNNSVEKTDVILFGTKKQIKNVVESIKRQQFKMPILAEKIISVIEEKPSKKPIIMGILNLTEDSFSDGGKYLDFEKAVAHAREMFEQGADIVDIGAESTRPGADEVPNDIQIKRIIPVLKELTNLYPDKDFSVDTRSSEVAKEVLKINKNVIINDVSGLCFDEKMAEVIIKNNAKIVICHSSSIPKDMQEKTEYKNIIDDIFKFFVEKTEFLTSKGLPKENIILDVGFGFGKTVEQNFELIKRCDEFLSLNYPLLAGVSRKSFIQKTVLDGDFDNLTASLCGELLLKGVSVFRVHDVKKTKDVIKLYSALI